MNRFENVRKVNSPNDFGSSTQTRRSIIIQSTTAFNTFSNTFDSRQPDIGRNLHNNPISQSRTSFPERNFNPKGSSTMTGSQMMESHIWHTRREICTLSEDRLAYIAKKFMKGYGTANEIREDNVRSIQLRANSDIPDFQQDEQSVKGMFTVMDQNRDKRVTYQDILSLCRRYLSFQRKQINYTPIVQQKLAVARRLFKQFDVQRNGFLTEKQVPYLLKETYRSLGKDFKATEEDIKSWMRLTDNDNDGRVFLPQYERSIVRALKKQGVQIYDD